MKIILALLALASAGCTTVNLPPSQKQSQEQNQSQTASQSATQTSSAAQETAHASDSRQGTVSQPIIVICNQVSSPSGRCVVPKDGEPSFKVFQPR